VDVHPIDGSGKATGSVGETVMGLQALSVVVDEQNRVFVAGRDSGSIVRYSFAAASLTPSGGHTPFDSPGNMVLTADKLYAISEGEDSLASFYVFDDALVLDWERPRLGSSTGDGAGIEVTPSGRYLYATNRDPENSIVAYDIAGAEPVYLGHQSSPGGPPFSLAMDPAEQLVIVGNIGDPPTLELFSIQDGGTLEHEGTEATSVTPFSVKTLQF
jgi:DNA-binding beta-propeller fold protein YncE